MKQLNQVTNIFRQCLIRGKKPYVEVPEKVFRDPLYFLAFGLGSGVSPYAPGTVGTLLAIPFYLLLRDFSVPVYIAVVGIIAICAMWISDKVSQEIHIHDHPGMNIDEFVGFFVAMTAAPHNLTFVILGFCLFRLFDIFKPFGIRYLDQHVGGGFGMILDDVVAGIYAAVILQIIAKLFY